MARAQPIRGDQARAPDPAPSVASASAADAGGERQARVAAEEREERLRFALQASGTGTWEWNITRDSLTWSPEVLELHGIGPSDVPAGLADYLHTVHPDDRRRVQAAIGEAVAEATPYDTEFRIVRPDGSVRWVRGCGRMFADAGGRPDRMIGTVQDVTARRVAEAERDRLVEAEREAAVLRDAFIGVISHELRTPITTIFGGTRVLARRWRDLEPDARDGILSDIVEESDRLYRLVEDLLVLSRVERGTLEIGDEPVHLARLVARVVASERGRWPGTAFVLDLEPNLPSVRGEDTYLEQVLRNLLGNAAKYGGARSTVTIATETDAESVTLRVLDEGPGIEGDELDRLFELFYRSPSVASSVPGAGIGLFVCRQLVAAMGGRVRAERRPGRGAAFVVTLPRYLEDA